MFRCTPFSDESFLFAVADASDHARGLPAGDQARYLASYLRRQEPRARTIVVESNYVDRHYLEEYAGYYATMLHPPPPKATRLHVLSRELDDAALDAWIEQATQGRKNYEEVCRRVQEAYLGFVVVRPLPSAPIGRTLLRPYPTEPERRCYEPARSEHDVHLAGLSFSIQGLPFQQQEQGVGACATAALWVALARVMKADGGRAVTPLAVTEAATRHVLENRALPAVSGLERNQMLGAIREFGYSPYVFRASAKELALFQLALKCYVRSGIPVVLRVDLGELGGHAITVAGFREDDDREGANEIRLGEGSHVLRSPGLSRLYVHDDRLGPYARAVWLKEAQNDAPGIELGPDEPGFEAFKKPVWIAEAIVPHYPKLRLTANDLVRQAVQLLPLVKELAKAGAAGSAEELRVDLRFVLGGRYLEELYSLGLAAVRVRDVVLSLELSRYVGVIRFEVGGQWLVDIVCDTTDIRREATPSAPIVAMLARSTSLVDVLRDLATRLGISPLVA